MARKPIENKVVEKPAKIEVTTPVPAEEQKEEFVQGALFDDMLDVDDSVENELAAVEPTGIAAFSNDASIFSTADMAPPMLRLSQALTPEVVDGEAKAGQWIVTGKEAVDEVHVVPLAFARRRMLRDADSGELLCSSDDAKWGIGDPGGSCEDCPMAKWQGDKGARKPPQCIFYYSYIVYAAEFDGNALLDFKKTSLGIGKMLNAAIARDGFGKVAIKLTAKLNKGRRGSYYTPALAPVKDQELKQDLIEQASMSV